jgi:hypothetical protein
MANELGRMWNEAVKVKKVKLSRYMPCGHMGGEVVEEAVVT